MSAILRLSVVFCIFVAAYCQVLLNPAGLQPNVVLVQGQAQPPSVKTNMFGLPSVGGGLADIGKTIAHWGTGVLRAGGQIV